MFEPAPAQPDRKLLRASVALVVKNPGPLVWFSAATAIVGFALLAGFDPVLQHFGLVYDPVKSSDKMFFIFDGGSNLLQALILTPLWAAVYGVAFAIVRQEEKPAKGASAAWTSFFPAISLALVLDAMWVGIDFGLRKVHLDTDFIASLILYSAVTVPLMLSFAAIVGLKMGPIEAVLYSLRRFEEAPWTYFRYYMNATFLACSGILLFCGGVVITLPIFAIAMAMLVAGGNFPGLDREPFERGDQ
jgi:hypothetical protein